MKRVIAVLFAASMFAVPAHAELKDGVKAPDFSTTASLGGKRFKFKLSEALKTGPVVLYFYPAAFTEGCTIEAHEFADAMDKFHALGATVIGVSHDNIDTLDKFSVSECRSKFAVAADPYAKVIEAYDAETSQHTGYAERISYVISPEGKVLFSRTDPDPDSHVTTTMQVMEKWAADHKAK